MKTPSFLRRYAMLFLLLCLIALGAAYSITMHNAKREEVFAHLLAYAHEADSLKRADRPYQTALRNFDVLFFGPFERLASDDEYEAMAKFRDGFYSLQNGDLFIADVVLSHRSRKTPTSEP